jgi:hypothetical protein
MAPVHWDRGHPAVYRPDPQFAEMSQRRFGDTVMVECTKSYTYFVKRII